MPSIMSSLGGLCSSVPRDDDETMKGKPSTDSRRSGGQGGSMAVAAPAGPDSEGSGTLAVVPREQLFVSEPDPRMFGNERNPSAGAGWTNWNWLKSRFHFSFAEYYNGPGQYGVVRVMNDDLVQPMRGFGTHPHRDMEIITFIVEGELTHQDSMGTKETLGKGSVQFMTAGTGVRHSEHNLQKAAPLRFIQTWVVPRSRGLRPNYGSFSGCTAPAVEARKNRWAHLVGDVEAEGGNAAPVRINQDCNMYAIELEPGLTSPPLEIRDDRQAYVLCMEGDIVGGLRNKQLRRHDAAELKGDLQLQITSGKEGAFVLLFEMARTRDSRH